MLPAMDINYLAVLACAIVAMPVGFLWFGPLFGKAWARHMGFGGMQQDSGSMGKAMAIFFLRGERRVLQLAGVLPARPDEPRGLGEEKLGAGAHQRELRFDPAASIRLHPVILAVSGLECT